ncbi:MAG: Uma2 family endonuclease [Bacteroidia bacterium]
MGAHKLPETYLQYTPEEYLQMEEKNEFRSEYVHGEIFAMAGASMNHNQAATNLLIQLHLELKKRNAKCRTFVSDMKLKLYQGSVYYYPDLVVTCSEKDLKDGKAVTEPTLLVEVLSATTMEKDLNEKLHNYLAIPSLQYYMVVSQYKISVILYVRTDIGWAVLLYQKEEDVVHLEKMGVSFSVSTIYEGINWEVVS